MKFDLQEAKTVRVPGQPVIKVIGLGGGGGNAADFMASSRIEGVEFICANTDAQALANSIVPIKVQIGSNGLGAGAKPEVGRQAAEDHIEEIMQYISDADMLFITAGMGGGTGTGAAPVVARVAREMGILTVGVVSKPFSFERRDKIAEAGIAELTEYVDSLITIPNDKLMEVFGKDFLFAEAFNKANEVLHGAVQGISEVVTRPGMINVDFEDLRTVMTKHGKGMMGVGIAGGEDRAIKAIEKAIANPLLEDIEVADAEGLLVNITSGPDFTLGDYDAIGAVVQQKSGEDAAVIIGTSIDPEMSGEIRVTVVATGIGNVKKPEVITPNLAGVNAVRSTEKAAAAPQEQTRVAPVAVVSTPSSVAEVSAEEKVAEIKTEEPRVTNPLTGGYQAAKVAVNAGAHQPTGPSDYLDIPAFLRRQQD